MFECIGSNHLVSLGFTLEVLKFLLLSFFAILWKRSGEYSVQLNLASKKNFIISGFLKIHIRILKIMA